MSFISYRFSTNVFVEMILHIPPSSFLVWDGRCLSADAAQKCTYKELKLWSTACFHSVVG